MTVKIGYEEGFYLVKIKGDLTVAYCDGNSHYPWSIIGSDNIFNESEFDAVYHRIDLEAIPKAES